ncbi:AraC family transcriptional regulator [Chryseobacterium sp. H3056]|uniref:AraC family transcriptional regulator n=1 Tax=Kaistella daneshvariae TaxID=2487074 RepID=A0A3N0WYC8_9FLAO|nr:helix-turn-helix domain-containing protein [Kaistella daneshvariae]ROI10082.1 AraC family transcriptional regulator [Kaistella daneshvariae]
MNAYHLDLLQNHIKQALERYCILCDASTEREYLTGKTVFLQTETIIRQYLRLFQALHFLDSGTDYYREGYVYTYSKNEQPPIPAGEEATIIRLITEAYDRMVPSVPADRFFLPVHVHQVSAWEMRIFLGVVNDGPERRIFTLVAHTTLYPPPAASVGNNRYGYLLKLIEAYDPDDGTLETFLSSRSLSYRQIQKDSTAFFGTTFYRHYLKLRMIPVLEDLLLTTLTYKEIAYKNGFSGYSQLYKLFHTTYRFPLHHIPRIAQDT